MAQNCLRYPAIDLSALVTYKSSNVTWTETEPSNTTVLVESAVDGETFAAITGDGAGGSIPGLSASQSMVGVFVTFRITLTTSDGVSTPTFGDLSVDLVGEGDALSSDTDDFYKFGAVKWLDGANQDISMEIKGWTDSTRTIELFLPMPYTMVVGDRFEIYPGCDKAVATCFAKFNNVVNFRGEPYVPGEDATLQYPDAT